MIFKGTGTLICVIESQDDYYTEGLARLCLTATGANEVTIDSNLEVCIHKVDGVLDDYKIETQRDCQQRANNDVAEELEKKSP